MTGDWDNPELSDEAPYFDDAEPEDTSPQQPVYRGSTSDPLFGLTIAGAVGIGLAQVIEQDADLRYTLVWGLVALFGVLAWLFGNTERIEQEDPYDLAWGIVFGLVLSIPVLAFVGGSLTEISGLLFPNMRTGTMLAYIIFVMPLAETLFFRGLLQSARSFWMVALICSVWQMVLFFPMINRGPLPLILTLVVLMANMLYGYVRDRNGLAAAWVCQITVNTIIFFFPFTGI